MSHQQLRNDDTCLNCGRKVEKRFCPDCGQENTETRQSFGGLVTHFLEDLTHYEGKFWRTIKYVLFRPAYLSKEFLAGKRISYLPPVRLYIFVSFITFFLPHMLPDFENLEHEYTPEQRASIDSIMNDSTGHFTYSEDLGFLFSGEYKTMRQLDSARKSLKGTPKEMDMLDYLLNKKSIELGKYSPRELFSAFEEALGRNAPKLLFVYMPLFAFILWLFHGKRRWMLFDHAIFTLHYFSFLLVMVALVTLVSSLGDWLQSMGKVSADGNGTLFYSVFFGVLLCWIWYFYKAHRKMYEESWIVSFIKSSTILFINTLLFGVLMICTMLLTVYLMH